MQPRCERTILNHQIKLQFQFNRKIIFSIVIVIVSLSAAEIFSFCASSELRASGRQPTNWMYLKIDLFLFLIDIRN